MFDPVVEPAVVTMVEDADAVKEDAVEDAVEDAATKGDAVEDAAIL